ncbi:MAG: hypothetical protein ACOWWM_12085 [Desulfobacterales bacterium]
MTEYEIIADPKDYGIQDLVEGLGGSPIAFPAEDRKKWAAEVGVFAEKLMRLSDKARTLQQWLASEDEIRATPASLKTLKIQLLKINQALDNASDLATRVECDIVPCDPDRP